MKSLCRCGPMFLVLSSKHIIIIMKLCSYIFPPLDDSANIFFNQLQIIQNNSQRGKQNSTDLRVSLNKKFNLPLLKFGHL